VKTKIDKLDLSKKLLNILRDNSIIYISDLTDKTPVELRAIDGFGLTSLYQVRESLKDYGAYWKWSKRF